MINATIDGISRAIYNEFGSDYEIYKEDIPQGFKEPCFSIVHVMSTSDAKSPYRYLRKNRFDIQFFPKSGRNEKSDMHSVTERLFLCLEHIYVLDNLCRGTKMSPEIVDGVLHFFVSYDFFVKRQLNDDNPMVTMNSKTNTEG